MSTKYDILNYLNLTCPSLARLYRTTGLNFLPNDFVLSKEVVEERLFFNSLEKDIKYPHFFLGEKSEIKYYLKNSQKNIKKIIKNQFFNGFFDKKFENKLKFYFFARQKLTARLMRRFNSYDFDEMRAYQEIYHLDPIFGEIFYNIFNEDEDFSRSFLSLEQEYSILYDDKHKIYEKEIASRKKKQREGVLNLAQPTRTKKTHKEILANVLNAHEENKEKSNPTKTTPNKTKTSEQKTRQTISKARKKLEK